MNNKSLISKANSKNYESKGPVPVIDGQTLKEMFTFATEWFAKSEADVNILNVFPVPDGDTGTNMLLTMRSCVDEAKKVNDASISAVSKAMAYGSFMGARGNSGVILSQIWRGIESSLRGKDKIGGSDLAESFQTGAVAAYEGLEKPVEGTMLTVIKEIAAATSEYCHNRNESISVVLHTAVEAARKAVANTPNLLPVLKEAGVVDSGGQGLLILLEGSLLYLNGQTDQLQFGKSKIINSAPTPSVTRNKLKHKDHSLLVFDDAISSSAIAVIAVATGEGIIDVFQKIGATAVVLGGNTMNPSTKDVLRAVDAIKSNRIIILPNDKNLVLVTEQVAEISGKDVQIVPTVSIPQGVAALLAFKPQTDLMANLKLMDDSRSSVKTIEVTHAIRSTRVNGFAIKKDQAIGLLDGKLMSVNDHASGAVLDILSKIDLAEAETMSIYCRNGKDQIEAEKVTEQCLREILNSTSK